MRIDHCRCHVLVSKQFLDCPNIVPVLKKVGREGMTKRMATGGFGNLSLAGGLFYRFLNYGFVQVMSVLLASHSLETRAF